MYFFNSDEFDKFSNMIEELFCLVFTKTHEAQLNFGIADLKTFNFLLKTKDCPTRQLDTNRIVAELEKNLKKQRFEFSDPLWHGLRIDEPLILEKIIQSCDNNPDRKKFRNFFTNREWVMSVDICNLNQPQFFVEKLDQQLISEFNRKKIRLYDSS